MNTDTQTKFFFDKQDLMDLFFEEVPSQPSGEMLEPVSLEDTDFNMDWASVTRRVVFKIAGTEEYYSVESEYNNHWGPFRGEGDEVQCYPVKPVEKTVTFYE